MTHPLRSLRFALPVFLGTLALGRLAEASNALEFPDNGVAAFSRGGAWLATATDPVAGHYNPAALATMPTSFGVGANFVFQKMCFTRLDADGNPATYSYGTDGEPLGAPYPETCNRGSGRPRFIPNLALAWRLGERVGVGLSVVPPSSLGATEWPVRMPVQERNAISGAMVTIDRPAPQRYLSLGVVGTILFPTLSVGAELAPGFRVGAGAIAGFAMLELQSMGISTQQASAPFDAYATDSRSQLEVEDWFIPGFVLSTHWSATPQLDLAAWYRWLDTIHATGDFTGRTPYFDTAGRPIPDDDSSVYVARSKYLGEELVSVEQTVPMEVRVGVRFHQPFAPAQGLEAEKLPEYAYPSRDPLRDDAWDLELDLTWANNSAASATRIHVAEDIPMGADGRGASGTVPRDLSRPTGYQDSFGARLGGQFNVVRNKVGLRWGSWVETPAVDDRYLTVTGVPGLRGGFGGGTVLRIQAFDLELGYQHLWNAGLDNGGDGALRAIVGSGPPDKRSYHAVNGGRIRQHANVVSAGLVARF